MTIVKVMRVGKIAKVKRVVTAKNICIQDRIDGMIGKKCGDISDDSSDNIDSRAINDSSDIGDKREKVLR